MLTAASSASTSVGKQSALIVSLAPSSCWSKTVPLYRRLTTIVSAHEESTPLVWPRQQNQEPEQFRLYQPPDCSSYFKQGSHDAPRRGPRIVLPYFNVQRLAVRSQVGVYALEGTKKPG